MQRNKRLEAAVYSTLLLAVLFPLIGRAAAPAAGMTTQILTATPTHTVVAAEFENSVLLERANRGDSDEQTADGFGVLLAISGHGNPTAHVLHYELGDVLGSSGSLDEPEWATEPDELILLSDPAVLHELRFVALNYRPYLQDENGQLRTVTRIVAEVTTVGGGGMNMIDDPVSFSGAFYDVYRTVFANLDELYPELSVRAPGRMLILVKQSRLDTVFANDPYWQRWLDLKRRKGYQVQIATEHTAYQATGDSTIHGFRQYIQNTYDDASLPDLEYLIIVADTEEIDSWDETNPETPGTCVGDNKFCLTAGQDSIPDILCGRITGVVNIQWAGYFAKAYRYEAEPYLTDTHWFQNATLVAGNFNDGTGIYPSSPVWNVFWARQWLLRDGCYTEADTFFYHDQSDPPPGQYRTAIRNDIDQGVSLILYRGWAASQEWQYPYFNVEDVNNLQNGRRDPAVFALVCGTGNFAYSGGPCLGEMFTTGLMRSVNEIRGAITFFGSSDVHTNTRHNNALLAGVVDGIVHGVRTTGALQIAAELEGWRQYPLERHYGNPPVGYYYILHSFNVLGDPEIPIYACQPGAFTVTAPSQVTMGQSLVNVTVNSNGQPVEGAVVTLRQRGSEEVAAVRTDALGQAYLPADFTAADTAQITVWKPRYLMQLINCLIVNAAFDPKIAEVNWSAGDDNLPNPGEAASFTLNIENRGSAPTTLTVTITSLDSRVTVNNGSTTVETIPPGEQRTSGTLSITLGGELFDGERPRLSVLLQDGSNSVTREIQVPVAAPDPSIVSLRVADGGNGILEAGEQAPIYVTIRNTGGQDATGLSADVSSFDNAISFPVNTLQWPVVNIGGAGESSQPFTGQLAAGVTPGRQILLRFAFRQNGVVMARKLYLMPTGVVTDSVPTGPDGYGYYAYEDIDVNYAAHPTYNWIELDSAYGGSGGTADSVRDDRFFKKTLPQPFTFYGQSYDTIWICSNGWFSFGQATVPEFRNWELPSPIGPPAIVCPFWDDLIIDRFTPNNDSLWWVWTRYDAGQSRYIILWRAFARLGLTGPDVPNAAYETFEAILEYPASGDGSIVFQYNQVTQIDNDHTWGNYATVGVEDYRHEYGLNLTFANMYPPSVGSLGPGRAIRITTQPPDNFNPVPDEPSSRLPERFALHEPYPNPFNPTTELRFDLPKSGTVTLRVYDLLGREVATLVDGWREAGIHTATFDGRALSSGLYIARLASGSQVQARKLMLVK
jgi:hypothetical protein